MCARKGVRWKNRMHCVHNTHTHTNNLCFNDNTAAQCIELPFLIEDRCACFARYIKTYGFAIMRINLPYFHINFSFDVLMFKPPFWRLISRLRNTRDAFKTSIALQYSMPCCLHIFRKFFQSILLGCFMNFYCMQFVLHERQEIKCAWQAKRIHPINY